MNQLNNKDIQNWKNQMVKVFYKLDGNALQWWNGEWCSRPAKHNKKGLEINEIFRVVSNIYNPSIEYLNEFKNIIKYYNIINFEIFTSEHTIKYDYLPKNNIVIFSAYKDGHWCDAKELEELSEKLNLDNGLIGEMKLEENILDVDITKYINNKFNISKTYLMNDQRDGEGYVFEYNNEQRKITTKTFKENFIKVNSNDLTKKILKSVIEWTKKNEKLLSENLTETETIKNVYKFFLLLINNININEESPISNHFELNTKYISDPVWREKINSIINNQNKNLFITIITNFNRVRQRSKILDKDDVMYVNYIFEKYIDKNAI